MARRSVRSLLAVFAASKAVLAKCSLVNKPGQVAAIPHWDLQSSSDLPDDLASLAQPGVDTSSWHHVPVSKCTLMGCLLETGHFNDEELWFSDNLKDVNWGMFTVPWIYRNEFSLDPDAGRYFTLQTHGITSRADIYLNGELVADSKVQSGSFTGRDYEITDLVADKNGTNVLVVQAHPTNYYYDLALGFIDWNPWPSDNGTGIWRDITIKQTGAVYLDTIRALVDINPATVTLKVEAKNLKDKGVDAIAHATITAPNGEVEITLNQTVTLAAGQTKLLEFEHSFDSPRVWWPKAWGEQPIYSASIEVSDTSGLSDVVNTTFGLRAVTSSLNEHEDIVFSVNDIPFQVMGAGYSPDMYLRWDPEKFEAIVMYMLDIGLNTIRLEGHFEHSELYEITDRLGLMVLGGFQCCNKWEAWDYNDHFEPLDIWDDADYADANATIIHETKIIQPHPSMLGFLVGSDFQPNDRATQIYVDALRGQGWQLPIVAAASKRGYPEILGPSGMKMEGPYDWVPPNYWYDVEPAEDRYGAAFGFGSELGPGVGTPEIGSLRRFLSDEDMDDLWQKPDKGLFHMSTNASSFYTRTIYNEGLYQRYGEPTSLEDYLLKAQIMDYEAIRAEHEGFATRWSEEHPATGMIYWMLNNAWPSLHWNQFDSYLHPAGSYFGSKVGARLEHVAYNYHSNEVWLINRFRERSGARNVEVEVINPDGTEVSRTTHEINTTANSAKLVGTVEGLDEADGVAFLRLILRDSEGEVLSRNVYWVAQAVDQLDWENSTWYYTPVTSFADYTSLFGMETASVSIVSSPKEGQQGTFTITLENEATVPAFFIRLNLVDGDGNDVNPVTWSDNYATLWPGETLELTVNGWDGTGKTVLVDGVNVEASNFTLK